MTTLETSKFTGLAQFHTTRWSVVVRAQSPATAGADESLESLCRQYWPPLYAYVRGRGYRPHDAQDLTQQFFAHLLEKNWLTPADRSQGKLRSFLLAAMKRFLANERDRSQAAKRGGLYAITSIDSEEGEQLLASAATLPENPLSPALRSDSMALSGASRRKQSPSSDKDGRGAFMTLELLLEPVQIGGKISVRFAGGRSIRHYEYKFTDFDGVIRWIRPDERNIATPRSVLNPCR